MYHDKINKYTICEKWISNDGLNCRYAAFITIFYFIFSSYIDDLKGDSYKQLQKFSKSTLNLVNNIMMITIKKL